MLGEIVKAFLLIRSGSRERYNKLIVQNVIISVMVAVQGVCLYMANALLKMQVPGSSNLALLLIYFLAYVLSSIGYLVILNKIFENLSCVFEVITARTFYGHLSKPYSEILSTNNAALISLFTND